MTEKKRNTKVISISLSPEIFEELEKARNKEGLSRSAFISTAIKETAEEERWEEIFKWGDETAKKFNITSTKDIDRIIHETKSSL